VTTVAKNLSNKLAVELEKRRFGISFLGELIDPLLKLADAIDFYDEKIAKLLRELGNELALGQASPQRLEQIANEQEIERLLAIRKRDLALAAVTPEGGILVSRLARSPGGQRFNANVTSSAVSLVSPESFFSPFVSSRFTSSLDSLNLGVFERGSAAATVTPRASTAITVAAQIAQPNSNLFSRVLGGPIQKGFSRAGGLLEGAVDELFDEGKIDLERLGDGFKGLLRQTGKDILGNLVDEVTRPVKTFLRDLSRDLGDSVLSILGIQPNGRAANVASGSGTISSGSGGGLNLGSGGGGLGLLGGLAALAGIGANAAGGNLGFGDALNGVSLLGTLFPETFGISALGLGGVTGAIDAFGASAFGFFNPAATATANFAATSSISLSGVLGLAGAGFAGGGLLANLVGLNPVGGSIGGGIGAGLGAIVGGSSSSIGTLLGIGGGPLGAILGGIAGSLIGGLFGGGKSVGATVAANIGPSGGRFAARGFGTNNGATVAQAQDFGRSITQNLNAILDLTKAGVAASGALPTQTQREGLFLDEPTRRFFGHGAGAAAAMMKFILLSRTSGLTAEERAIIQGQSSMERIAEGLATLRAIEEIETQSVGVNPVVASLNQVTARFGEVREQARSFGIDPSRVSGAEISALRGLESEVLGNLEGGQDVLRSVLGLDALTALSSTLTATFFPKSPTEIFSETKDLFEEVSSEALAGDVTAVQRFPGLAQTLLGQARALFASGPGFSDLFRSVNETLNQLIENQKEVEESFGLGFIETLEKNNVNQIDALRQQIEPLLEGLDRIERELRDLGETPFRAA